MMARLFAVTALLCLGAGCGSQSQVALGTPPAPSGQTPATPDGDNDDGAAHQHGMLGEADQNKDGKVTLEEARAAAAARFAEADANHDGALEGSEMEAMHKKQMGQGGSPGLGRIDKDGNGSISRDEAPPRLAQHFDRLDTNHDGSIDPQELAAVRKGMQARLVDADGDGKVTAAEHAAFVDKMFKMMDADGDGAITEAELKVGRGRQRRH